MKKGFSSKKINSYLKEKKRLVDQGLDKYVPKASAYPQAIHKAMRYSLFTGGKRLRPILTIAAAATGNGKSVVLLPTACAVEIIHTFSLIHDDLPSLDDDDFRRGKPSCHRAFGEDIAILAGDALLVLGFGLLGESERMGRGFLKPGILIREMAGAIGTCGMIGGQVVDLESQKKKIGARGLKYINEKKTAALITGALRIGGIIGQVPPRELTALTNFGKAMGVSFQIVDDMLDQKKDNRKKSMSKVKELTLKAESFLKPLGERGEVLKAINKAMVCRVK